MLFLLFQKMICSAYHKKDTRSGIAVEQSPAHYQKQDNTLPLILAAVSYDSNAQGQKRFSEVRIIFLLSNENFNPVQAIWN